MQSNDADDKPLFLDDSANLCFPLLTLDSELHEWLAQPSRCTMAHTCDVHSDDTSSSLGDSAYEMLGDSTILTSSEEDRDDANDSIASADENGPDDVASLVDSGEADEARSSFEPTELPGPNPADHVLRFDSSDDVSGSGMTVVNDGSPAIPSIEFEEPPCYGAERVAVIHTIRNFDEDATTEMLKYMHLADPPARISATIRQTMTKQGLAVDEPFRMVYVGSPSAKGEIVAKIAAALAVPVLGPTGQPGMRQRSSRFNVVPISAFGAGKAPEVELIDSFGLELVVDDCTSAKTASVGSTPDAVSLRLNDSFWYSSERSEWKNVHEPHVSWQVPHIAVFFCSDDDSVHARQTRHYARSFMIRHHISSIVISQTPLYGRPGHTYALDHHSVHMCLESRSPVHGTRVHKRLPIDLSTFLNLDARQMNRNLACLTGLHAGRSGAVPAQRVSSTPRDATVAQDPEHLGYASFGLAQSFYALRERKGQEWKALLMFGAFFVCAVLGTVVSLACRQMEVPRWSLAELASSQVTPTASSAPLATMTPHPSSTVSSPGVLSSPTPSRLLEKGTPNSLSLASGSLDLASLLLDPALISLNESDKFKMQLVGECHMILRPPHRFLQSRKSPRLLVKVMRNEQQLQVNLSKLFDGVYALQLPREEAYGPLNVTVWTQSKPRMAQSFEVDFGTPWLKVAGWKKAAQMVREQVHKDVQHAQSAMHGAMTRLSGELSTMWDSAGQSLTAAQHEAEHLQHLSHWMGTRTQETSAQLLKRGKALSAAMASRLQGMSSQVAEQAGKIDATSAISNVLDSCRALSHRAAKTFTAKRAQKQARRLWWKLLGRDVNSMDEPVARSGRAGSRKIRR
ncbi:MAG: hypothetical protein M1838_006136 [Thelocarpon superellum]|nr:MAG: hypothetical protein M1838_006136 [Thelocarpon superellum]